MDGEQSFEWKLDENLFADLFEIVGDHLRKVCIRESEKKGESSEL